MSLPDAWRSPWWRLATFGAEPSGDRLTRIQRSPQYVAGELRNSLPTAVVKPGADLRVTRAQLTGWRRRKPGFAVPVHQVDAADFGHDPAPDLRLTWLGHATVLAELDERRVLFDPVWSFRCSPFAFAGPSRCHPVPLSLEEVPPLDVVAISHDHYDHLDMPTVRVLARTTLATFVVPLGVGAHLEHWGIRPDRIVELDWHETASVAGLAVTATPARHYCSRGLRRTPTALWSSWVVAGPRHRVFHCGDSGYFDGLAAIGDRYGPFDATMMPVGAYHELWPDVHMTPEQAVRAHHELAGLAMLPIHWGTFNIAPQPWAEPIERTIAAAQESGTSLLTPRVGQPVAPAEADRGRPANPWWRPEPSRDETWSPYAESAAQRANS